MKKIYTCLGILLLAAGLRGQTPVVEFQSIVTGLSSPVDVVNAGDGTNRLFVVQQTGAIRIVDGTTLLATPFLNISGVIASGGERGLLSVAFHPNYEINRYFFVYYTAPNGDLTIARYQTPAATPNVADPATGTVLLTIPHSTNSNHNGGRMLFGSDGYLYLGTGDGGSGDDPPNNAQNPASLLGKMLRIDVNDFTDVTPPLYSIPTTNPYFGADAGGVRDEIIALGLRNPFRWSFDRQTGDMWIADVGQNAWEEVNFRAAASILTPTNYGWRCREGNVANPNSGVACPPPVNNTDPVFVYGHNSTTGGFSITGGHVYRGTPQYPAMFGFYMAADYVTGNFWTVKQEGSIFTAEQQTLDLPDHISGFGEDEAGGLYAVRLNNNNVANTGELFRVITNTILPVRLISFTGRLAANNHAFRWEVAGEVRGDVYILQRMTERESDFSEVLRREATATRNTGEYNVSVPEVDGVVYYRLKMINADGTVAYSPIINFKKLNTGQELFTGFVKADRFQVTLNAPADALQITDASGRVLIRRQLSGQTGTLDIDISNVMKGVFFTTVYTGKDQVTQKFFH